MNRITQTTLALLALAALLPGAGAMPVHRPDGAPAIEAHDAADGSAVSLESPDFQLLGVTEAGDWLLFSDGRFLTAPQAALRGLGAEQVAALPDADGLETLRKGAKGPEVTALQQALIDLGYLAGGADGSYGGASQRAVAAFQRDNGIPDTGEADPMTRLLIASAAQPALTLAADGADSFAPILGQVDFDLEPAVARGLWLEYDDIPGTGEIVNGNAVALEPPAQADIDRRRFAIRFCLRVIRGDDGAAAIQPAAVVTCQCVRRPIVDRLLLKSGDARAALEVAELTSALDGVESVETAVLPLDDAALALIAGCVEAGELKMRVACRYESYDVSLTPLQRIDAADVASAYVEGRPSGE